MSTLISLPAQLSKVQGIFIFLFSQYILRVHSKYYMIQLLELIFFLCRYVIDIQISSLFLFCVEFWKYIDTWIIICLTVNIIIYINRFLDTWSFFDPQNKYHLAMMTYFLNILLKGSVYKKKKLFRVLESIFTREKVFLVSLCRLERFRHKHYIWIR